MIDLYWALVRGDMELAVHAYETWGFADLRKVIDTLNLWAAFVYAPLMENRPRLIEETNSGAHGRTVAFNVQRAAARDRRGHAAAQFVLMDRAAIGLGSVFMHLQAEVNWHQLFMELIKDFDVKALGAVRPRRSRRRACRCQADAPRAWRRSGRGFMVRLTSGP